MTMIIYIVAGAVLTVLMPLFFFSPIIAVVYFGLHVYWAALIYHLCFGAVLGFALYCDHTPRS